MAADVGGELAHQLLVKAADLQEGAGANGRNQPAFVGPLLRWMRNEQVSRSSTAARSERRGGKRARSTLPSLLAGVPGQDGPGADGRLPAKQ